MPINNTTQETQEIDDRSLLEKLMDESPLLKSGVKKVQKNQDEHIDEAMKGGVSSTEILKGLIEQHAPQFIQPKRAMQKPSITPQGDVQKAGWLQALVGTSTQAMLDQQQQMSEIQKNQSVQSSKSILTPEQQISTLTKTQDMLKNMGIKAKVDVTATGVPTLSSQPELGLNELSAEQQIQAISLARKVAGVRGADRLIPSISASLQSGKNIDQIEDELRMAGQSSKFAGPIRSAAQQIMAGQSSTEKQSTFDDLDDLSEDIGQQQDYLKRMAIKNASIDQQTRIMGKERTIEFLGEIQDDLNALERKGISTGFFSGNIENLSAKVGQVKSPELREITTRISTAIMNYRRDMTGVNFGEKEGAEYKTLFPNINKVGTFNTATIKALKGAFGGDVKKFYSQSMGSKNYNALFGDGKTTQPQAQEQPQSSNQSVQSTPQSQSTEPQQGWNQDKEARYQELLKKRGQ